VAGRVEDRRVAVGLGEGLGQLVGGQPLHLGEDAAGGLAVDLGVRPGPEDVVAAEDLEEVELDVAEVGPVVTHRAGSVALVK